MEQHAEKQQELDFDAEHFDDAENEELEYQDSNLLTVGHRDNPQNTSTLTLVDENTNNSNNKIIYEELEKEFQFDEFNDNEFDDAGDVETGKFREEEMDEILNSENKNVESHNYDHNSYENGYGQQFNENEFDDLDDDDDMDNDEYDRQVQIAKLSDGLKNSNQQNMKDLNKSLERQEEMNSDELDNYAITALESGESVPTVHLPSSNANHLQLTNGIDINPVSGLTNTPQNTFQNNNNSQNTSQNFNSLNSNPFHIQNNTLQNNSLQNNMQNTLQSNSQNNSQNNPQNNSQNSPPNNSQQVQNNNNPPLLETMETNGRAFIILTKIGDSLDFDKRVVALEPSEIRRVGRMSNKDNEGENNTFFDCKVLSRRHAKIWYDYDTEQFYLEDTKSSNGTFINGGKIEADAKKEIFTDDEIKFGVQVTISQSSTTHGCINCNVKMFHPNGMIFGQRNNQTGANKFAETTHDSTEHGQLPAPIDKNFNGNTYNFNQNGLTNWGSNVDQQFPSQNSPNGVNQNNNHANHNNGHNNHLNNHHASYNHQNNHPLQQTYNNHVLISAHEIYELEQCLKDSEFRRLRIENQMKQLQERFERMKDRQKFSWKSMVGETQMLLKIDQLQARVESMTKDKGMVEEQGEHDLEKILVEVQSFEDKTCKHLNELIQDKSELQSSLKTLEEDGQMKSFKIEELQERLENDNTALRNHNENLQSKMETTSKEIEENRLESDKIAKSIQQLEASKLDYEQKINEIQEENDRVKKSAEQSNFEVRSVERECQQLKENCLNLQKQLEETKDQREKFQMECKELRESDADRSIRVLSEDIVDKVISSAEREISSSSKDGNLPETENEENCIKSCDSNPGPPRMESVAVGYDHFDGSSFDSENDDESSSEINDDNYKERVTKMKVEDNLDEKHDSEHNNASGDAPPVSAGMDVQNWALYISNQIMSTFTEQKNVFSASDLTSICHVSQLSPYQVVDTLLPVLKNKIDAVNGDRPSSERRDSIASTASSDMAIQTEAQQPEKLDTKINENKIIDNLFSSIIDSTAAIFSKTDSSVQCDLEKSPLLKLTAENSKLAKKLDNLQNDHSSVVKKLDSSKKLVDEDKEKFKSFKKSTNEEIRLIEQEKSTLKKLKTDADNKLRSLEQKNKSLESDVKNVEIKFSDEKKKLRKKLEKEVVEGKHDLQDLQKKLELREQNFSQKLDLMDAQMKEMEKRKKRRKIVFSLLILLCFTLALPFLDIFICCDNPIDYARQLLSWIDQSRFERLSNGEC